MSDIKTENTERCADEFGCEVIDIASIYDLQCDVFAPCALGGVINDQTLPRFNTGIVAGAANTQLDKAHYAYALHQRHILFVPDYVINVGGLVQVVLANTEEMQNKVNGIYDIVTEVLERSALRREPPLWSADRMAEAVLYEAANPNSE